MTRALGNTKKEIVIKGSKPFEDLRGKILNYEFDEPMNWLGTITSKKGCIRSNHYHPIQTQRVLLIYGKYISIYKDLDNAGPIEDHLIIPGDLVITPPNVAHTMIFLEDSMIINLVNGEREHGNYEEHTKPYVLVSEEKAKEYISKYKKV